MKRSELKNALRHFGTIGMTDIDLNSPTKALEAEYLRIISGRQLSYGVEIEFSCPSLRMVEIDRRFEAFDMGNWNFTRDESCGFEVSSPILGDGGAAEIVKATEAIKAVGGKINNNCGLHVHIGISDFSVDQIRDLVLRYQANECHFDSLQPYGRRGDRNQYCMPIELQYNQGALLKAQTVRELANAAVDRYSKLNLYSFEVHGTVEFRQHCGTLEADEINNWVEFLKAFVVLSNKYTIADQGFEYLFGHESRIPYFAQRKNAYATV